MRLKVLLLVPEPLRHLPVYKHVEMVTMVLPSSAEVTQALVEHRPSLMLSLGSHDTWLHLYQQPLSVRMIWNHFTGPDLPEEGDLLFRYLGGAIQHPLEEEHPLISVITTTFHSGKRIERPWQSLLSQTYDRWEWVVCDDSKDHGDTYAALLAMAATDTRVRVYKPAKHSGFIGEMKQMAAGLARGKWIVELDHDDVIDSRLFEYLVDIHNTIPQAVFVYSDFTELYEHTEAPFAYPEGYGLGYGAYARQYVRGKYHYCSQTPQINPVTLSHIVGVPNHIRIWRADMYSRVGKHKHALPVVDDYELILNTFVHTDFEKETWVRIVAPLYFQYRNEGGSNFTFIRNDLIQRLVPLVHSMYKPQLEATYKTLRWETELTTTPTLEYKRCWLMQGETSTYSNVETFYVPEDRDPSRPCISIVVIVGSLTQEVLHRRIQSIFGQTYGNWIAFVIGSRCRYLDECMQRYSDPRMRYFNLESESPLQATMYALRMLVKTRYCTFYNDDNDSSEWAPDWLQALLPDATSTGSTRSILGNSCA
jgi:O-antigen biosynthesis protein